MLQACILCQFTLRRRPRSGGAMRGGIGQGTTPNKIHLSEVSQYTNPVEQIEEGLFKAVPVTPEQVRDGTAIDLVTTALSARAGAKEAT